MVDSNLEIFVNGRGLTNGPEHFNGDGLTSSEWRVISESKLERIKTMGMFKRLVKWLMKYP